MNLTTGTPIACSPGWVPDDADFAPQVTEVDISAIIDPCLAGLISEIGVTGHQSMILKTYDQQQYTPSTKHRYKLKYEIDNTLVNANGQSIPARSFKNVLSDGTNEITVKLNTSMFQWTSKEWVADVIIHELMHGILYVTRPDLVDQALTHEFMFDNGIPNSIALGLKELFPNLAASDATALGMHGLADGYLIAGTTTIKPGKDDFAVDNYGQHINTAVNTAVDFMNRIKGTPYCP
jgi:hypothetical protein